MDGERKRFAVLKKHPNTNILSMVSVPVRTNTRPTLSINNIQKAIGIASGLLFLHQNNVIHSDMKSVRDMNRLL